MIDGVGAHKYVEAVVGEAGSVHPKMTQTTRFLKGRWCAAVIVTTGKLLKICRIGTDTSDELQDPLREDLNEVFLERKGRG